MIVTKITKIAISMVIENIFGYISFVANLFFELVLIEEIFVFLSSSID